MLRTSSSPYFVVAECVVADFVVADFAYFKCFEM